LRANRGIPARSTSLASAKAPRAGSTSAMVVGLQPFGWPGAWSSSSEWDGGAPYWKFGFRIDFPLSPVGSGRRSQAEDLSFWLGGTVVSVHVAEAVLLLRHRAPMRIALKPRLSRSGDLRCRSTPLNQLYFEIELPADFVRPRHRGRDPLHFVTEGSIGALAELDPLGRSSSSVRYGHCLRSPGDGYPG
jgi:hypothetical protein